MLPSHESTAHRCHPDLPPRGKKILPVCFIYLVLQYILWYIAAQWGGLSIIKEKRLNENDIVPEAGVEKKQYKVIFIISIKQCCSLPIYCGHNCGPKHPSVYKHSFPKASELPNKNKLQPWYVINRKQARVNTALGTKPGIANTEPQGTDTTQNTSEAHSRAWCEHLLSSKG